MTSERSVSAVFRSDESLIQESIQQYSHMSPDNTIQKYFP